MATVLVYRASSIEDLESGSVTLDAMPLGLLQTSKTSEGDTVWVRPEVDDPTRTWCVFGSLAAPPSSATVRLASTIAVFYAVRHTPADGPVDAFISTLRRPTTASVMRALEHREKDRSGAVAATATSNSKHIYALYSAIVSELLSLLSDADEEISKKHTPTAATRGKRRKTTTEIITYEFEGDGGSWVENADPVWTSEYEKAWKGKVKLPHAYSYNGHSHEIDASTAQPDSSGHEVARFIQTNTSTKRVREVRICVTTQTVTASTLTKKAQAAQETDRLTLLAGEEFFLQYDSAKTAQLKSYDLDCHTHTLRRDGTTTCFNGETIAPLSPLADIVALVDDTTRLMQYICDFSGTVFDFKYDPAKTKMLIKPLQARNIVALITSGKATHARPVVHGTSDEGLALVEQDDKGLDLMFSNPNCRYGSANYVATTMHAPEGGRVGHTGYNTSSVPGQVVLLVLFSPRASWTQTSKMSPMHAYNFICSSRDTRKNHIMDAIAVKDNGFLLPIAILSP